MVKNVIFLAVFLFGYTVQAITGFAGNIFCMPVGTLTLGLQSSVSILNATGFLACTVLAVLNIRSIHWRELGKIVGVMLPFVVLGAVAMALFVDGKVGLIFVAALPVLTFVVIGVMLLTTPRYKRIQRGLDGLLGRTRDNLEGGRVLRAFAQEDAEISAFTQENEALSRLQRRTGRIAALSNSMTSALVNLAIAAVLWSGAVRVDCGVLTQGQVVALVNYMSQILVELVKLANLVVSISKAVACGSRIESLLELETGMPQAAKPLAPAPAEETVRFDHVTFAYPGAGAPSLTDVTFTARRGETIGVIGGTGSGKSSLIGLIPRFYDVTSGRVLVDGVDVRDWDMEALRRRIGLTPQHTALLRGSLRENLSWRNENASEDELNQALEAAQALPFVREKPDGLDMQVEQNGRNFSGGQRQRLTIARALVGKPEILILDDSSSALDFATERDLRHALSRLTDTTVFIVSQRAASVPAASQILVLDDGIVCGLGTHEELMRCCPVYQEIYYSQFPDEKPKGGAQA